MKQGGKLLAFVAVFWLLLAAPAYRLAGTDGLLGLSIAAILCLIPGLIVFLMVPMMQVANAGVLAALGSTTVRLFFVAVGTIVTRDLRPDLKFREFHLWVLIFYLATLLFETLLLVKFTESQTGATVSEAHSDSSEQNGRQG